MKTSNYTHKKQMSYSRKEYMGGISGSKIVRFTMGNTSKDFSHRVKMVSLKDCQIKHNSLESARIASMRHLERNVERTNARAHVDESHIDEAKEALRKASHKMPVRVKILVEEAK